MVYEEEVNTMLRGFVIVGLIMFSVSVLSASAEMWKDSFDGGELKEEWKPGVSVAGNPPSNWKVEDGVLKGHWANFGQQLLLMEYPSSDYTIQVRCRLDEANNPEGGAGIVFRSYGPGHDPAGWQGTSEFYGFQILRKNLNLWRIGADWWDTIVVEPPIGGAGEHSDNEWYTRLGRLSCSGQDQPRYSKLASTYPRLHRMISPPKRDVCSTLTWSGGLPEL